MSCGFWAARDIGRNRSNSTYQTIFCVGSHQHDGFEWGIDHFDNVPEKFWELKHAQHRGHCVPTSKDAGVRSNKIVVSIITEIVSHEFRGDTVTWWSGDPYVIWICRCHRGVLCSPPTSSTLHVLFHLPVVWSSVATVYIGVLGLQAVFFNAVRCSREV